MGMRLCMCFLGGQDAADLLSRVTAIADREEAVATEASSALAHLRASVILAAAVASSSLSSSPFSPEAHPLTRFTEAASEHYALSPALSSTLGLASDTEGSGGSDAASLWSGSWSCPLDEEAPCPVCGLALADPGAAAWAAAAARGSTPATPEWAVFPCGHACHASCLEGATVEDCPFCFCQDSC